MRKVRFEEMRERQSMREYNTERSPKFDLRAQTPKGDVIHVCRYKNKKDAQEGRERLKDACKEQREIIGLPEQYSLSVHPVK